jgi:hypothetical protein
MILFGLGLVVGVAAMVSGFLVWAYETWRRS